METINTQHNQLIYRNKEDVWITLLASKMHRNTELSNIGSPICYVSRFS
uniref:Uncharacterized protein n=1 Tax=Rhizophora mucronata TaxID=61149 RepID=A0A2P2PFW9_RHIMU